MGFFSFWLGGSNKPEREPESFEQISQPTAKNKAKRVEVDRYRKLATSKVDQVLKDGKPAEFVSKKGPNGVPTTEPKEEQRNRAIWEQYIEIAGQLIEASEIPADQVRSVAKEQMIGRVATTLRVEDMADK